MAVAPFDALKFANTLKAADVPVKQAEAVAAALGEALTVNLKDLVTKDDLRQSEERLNGKIDLVRTELGGDIKLLKWMVGAAISLLIALIVLLLRSFLMKLP